MSDPGRRMAGAAVILAAAIVATLVSSCGSHSAAPTARTATTTETPQWIDEPVTFQADGMTVYATYRHPVRRSPPFPAALLIAGSGPTDRNGNSSGGPPTINTLKTLAMWLSDDGVASLRYDKLGSGSTGIGSFAADPASIGVAPFEDEAAAALSFLTAQPGVDRGKIAVFGHSEGALFALLLATSEGRQTPEIHALGLLEPLSVRYLDVITTQVTAQVHTAEQSGKLSHPSGAALLGDLNAAVAAVREGAPLPPNLPQSLSAVFTAGNARFLAEADKYDPAQLAAKLKQGTPVLITCSNADTQVTCGEVEHLASGLEKASAATDFVHLTGVDHVLKEDPTGSPANYASPLPFSSQLQTALAAFVAKNL